jgi:hypothetical protein
MFKQSKGEEDDDEGKMFKPVRPRRERLTEDAADEKEGNPEGDEAMGETKGRRRRVDEEKKDEEAPLGWMTSPNKRTTNKLKIEEDEDPVTASKSNNKHFGDGDFDDGIMLIPELDEDGGGDMEGDTRVAQAPRMVHRKIPTLAELEKDARATVPVHEGQYDLGVLLRTLVPADQVMEGNEAWEFDQLLREVTDELTQTPKTVVSATISQSAMNAKGKSKGDSKKKASSKNYKK